jgi:hypothetical protein
LKIFFGNKSISDNGVLGGPFDLSVTFADALLGFYNEVMFNLPAEDPFVGGILRRHSRRWNVGFCDEHVENLRANRLFDISKRDIAQRWNNGHARNSQTGKEWLHFFFCGDWRWRLWTLEKSSVANEPVGAGFFSVERGVMKSASLTKRTDCELEVHGWICERMVAVGEIRFIF